MRVRIALVCAAVIQLMTVPSIVAQIAPVCRAGSTTSGAVTRDSGGIAIVENWSRQWQAQEGFRLGATPTVRIGENVSDTNYVFGSVLAATRLSTGEIVIVDGTTMDIRVYDAAGRFLRRIGRKGQGPGEFQRASMLQRLPGDTLLIADNTSRRVTYITPAGTVVRVVSSIVSIPFSIPRPNAPPRTGSTFVQVRGRFTDGSYLGTSITGNQFGPDVQTQVARSTMLLHHLDASATRIDTIATLSAQSTYIYVFKDRSLTDMSLPFGPNGSIAVTPAAAFLSDGGRNEIRAFSPRGTLARIMRDCADPRSVSTSDRNRFRDSVLATRTVRDRGEYEEIFAALPFPTTMPSYTQLLTDDSGRIWAKNFVSGNEAESWQLFSNTGRLLGRVALPRGITPLEIGRDYMLARFVDADGVQSVRMFSISG